MAVCSHCKTTNDLKVDIQYDNELRKEFKPLTKDKKEILKQHIGCIKYEGFLQLMYDVSTEIASKTLDKFKKEVDLTEDEIKLLELYNDFSARFQ